MEVGLDERSQPVLLFDLLGEALLLLEAALQVLLGGHRFASLLVDAKLQSEISQQPQELGHVLSDLATFSTDLHVLR